MNDPRPHLAGLAAVLADAAERAAPLFRALSSALGASETPSGPSIGSVGRRQRATPRPTVEFSELDAARADRALRRAGYRESDK